MRTPLIFGLVAAALTLGTAASAIAPPRVGVASDGTNDAGRTRVIDELAMRGFDARVADRDEQEKVGRASSLSAYVLVSSRRVLVIVAQRNGESLERREAWIDLGQDEEGAATGVMRAVEFLRASLIEVGIGLPKDPDKVPKAAHQEGGREPQPRRDKAPEEAPSDRVSVGLAGGLIRSMGGVGPNVLFSPSISARLASSTGMRLVFGLPVSSAAVSGPEGEATVHPTLFAVGGWWTPAETKWVSPYLGLGVGAAFLSIRAQASPGYIARDDSRMILAPYVGAGLSFLPGRFRIRLDAMTGPGLQRAHVRFAERDVGTWGTWITSATIGLEVGL